MFFIKKVIFVVILMPSINALAQVYNEQGVPNQANNQATMNVGDCRLIGGLYKVLNENYEMIIIPLKEAKGNPKCRKLINYDDVREAYAEKFQHKKCSEIELVKKEVGATCVSSSDSCGADGCVFKRVEQGIKDVSSGIVLSTNIISNVNHQAATNHCIGMGLTLPTGWPENKNGQMSFPNYDSEFVILEKNGFRDVLLSYMEGKIYWSKSIKPGNNSEAYDFYGDDGSIDSFDRRATFYFNSAICILK